MKIVAGKQFPWDFVALWLYDADGKNVRRAKLEWEEYPDGEYSDPFVKLNATQAQSLIDQLWDCGFRPTQGAGSAGSLAATERHLQDMQKITFGLLKKQGV